MRCVRIKFAKTGRAKYISHLDLTRFMSRAIRRAEIPLWYTEGFNPHPYMTFALPLPLGIESFCETMDIRVEGEITNGEILDKLRAVGCPDLPFLEVFEPQNDASEIALAEYEICIEADDSEAERVFSALACGRLSAEKLSKSGKRKVMKSIDISGNISDVSTSFSNGLAKISLTLPAGIQMNISPLLFIDSVNREIGHDTEVIGIKRLGLFIDGKKEFV